MSEQKKRIRDLGLLGVLQHYDEIQGSEWLPWLLDVEEQQRTQRSMERRERASRVGTFKNLVDFDWGFPKKIDRQLVTELFQLGFIEAQSNIIFLGPNGVGKTMLSKNLAYRCLQEGHNVLFTTASAMLNGLAAEDSTISLERRLKRYSTPRVLFVDEVGYLSYGNRHADLLFEVVTRRYELGRPVVVTTNKMFRDWVEVFPNAGCVVTLVDRLVHRSEIVQIVGDSYRRKEATERKGKRKASQPSADDLA